MKNLFLLAAVATCLNLFAQVDTNFEKEIALQKERFFSTRMAVVNSSSSNLINFFYNIDKSRLPTVDSLIKYYATLDAAARKELLKEVVESKGLPLDKPIYFKHAPSGTKITLFLKSENRLYNSLALVDLALTHNHDPYYFLTPRTELLNDSFNFKFLHLSNRSWVLKTDEYLAWFNKKKIDLESAVTKSWRVIEDQARKNESDRIAEEKRLEDERIAKEKKKADRIAEKKRIEDQMAALEKEAERAEKPKIEEEKKKYESIPKKFSYTCEDSDDKVKNLAEESYLYLGTGYNISSNTFVIVGERDYSWNWKFLGQSDYMYTTYPHRHWDDIQADSVAKASWISPNPGASAEGKKSFIVNKCFCLKEKRVDVFLSLYVIADDRADLKINGVDFPGFQSLHPHRANQWNIETMIDATQTFNISSSLQVGKNCLEFYAKDEQDIAFGLFVHGFVYLGEKTGQQLLREKRYYYEHH